MAFLSNPVYGVGWSCLDAGLLGGYKVPYIPYSKTVIYNPLKSVKPGKSQEKLLRIMFRNLSVVNETNRNIANPLLENVSNRGSISEMLIRSLQKLHYVFHRIEL